MKPIFEPERLFLNDLLNIDLPKWCWRDGSKIYLNGDKRDLIVKFKVEGEKAIKQIDRIYPKLIERKQLTFQEEVNGMSDRLDYLEKESIENTIKFIQERPGYELRVSYSGGKDSDATIYIMNKVFEKLGIKPNTVKVDFFNTTNDTAQTYLHVKKCVPSKRLEIHNPEIGWYQWLKDEKNYFLPTILTRSCCAKFKEGSLKKILDKNTNYILFLGVRKQESVKRSKYDWDINEAWIRNNPDKPLNVPSNWKRFAPLINFSDYEIWLYIFRENIEVNPMYELGFNRTGCLICPYSSSYNDLLVKKYYPFQWNRWKGLLTINYDMYEVQQRDKWTLQEFIDEGRWKGAISKDQMLLTKSPTPNNIQNFAKFKGISYELAEKYFNRKCECGKRLNVTEVGMFLKLFGRFEGIDDNRQYLCRKCMCEKLGITKEQYLNKIREFRNDGCPLL